jgi:hypothetical protein
LLLPVCGKFSGVQMAMGIDQASQLHDDLSGHRLGAQAQIRTQLPDVYNLHGLRL